MRKDKFEISDITNIQEIVTNSLFKSYDFLIKDIEKYIGQKPYVKINECDGHSLIEVKIPFSLKDSTLTIIIDRDIRIELNEN